MSGAPQLSKREIGILRGLAAGLKLVQVTDVIGRRDHVSVDHVKRTAARLYRKLGSETATGAVFEAIKAGVLPCPCPHHTTAPTAHPEGTTQS